MRQGKRGGDRRIVAPFLMGREKCLPLRSGRGSTGDAAGTGGKGSLDAQHAAHQGRIHGGRFRGIGGGVIAG